MASVAKRPDGRWRARYRDPDGKEHSKHFARKIDAERYIVTVAADVLRGQWLDPAAGKVTFAAFAARWLAAQTFEESTREAVARRLRVHVLPAFGSKELRTIAPSAVQAWLRGRQQMLAASYVRVLLANLSAILNAAVDDGMISRNPCKVGRSVRAPRVEQRRLVPWSPEQVRAVVEVLPARYRALPVVAAGCGLRQGEVFGLRVEDVNFLGRKLRVEQQVKTVGNKLVIAPPKGGRTRGVPLPDAVALALAEHLARYPAQDDGLVFTSREGHLLNKNYINAHVWKPALRAAGVEPSRDNGMHALRHFYASALLDAGESIRAVSEYLGHADPGFTLRTYCHLLPSSEDRARRAVDAVLNGAGADHLRTSGVRER